MLFHRANPNCDTYILAGASVNRAAAKRVSAAVNRPDMAQEWGFFEDSRYQEAWELLDSHIVDILDLSTIDSGRHGRRLFILSAPTRFARGGT